MEPISSRLYFTIQERAEASDNAYHRDLTLHAIAVALFKNGNQGMAFEVRLSIRDKFLHASALIEMLKPLYSSLQYERLVEIILGLPVDWVHEKATGVDLPTIINLLVKRGHLKKALEIWKEVGKDSILQMIGCALSGGKSNDPPLSIVSELVKRDGLEAALNFVRPEMTDALMYLCKVLINLGDHVKAIELASQLEDENLRALILRDIALSLLHNGKIDEALELGNKILVQRFLDYLLQEISKVLVQNKAFEKAVEVANRISEDNQRAVALMNAAMEDKLENGIKVMRLIPGIWLEKITSVINRLDKNNPALLKLAKAQDDLDLAEGIVKALQGDALSDGLKYLFDVWINRGNVDKALDFGYAMQDQLKKKTAFLELIKPKIENKKIEEALILAQSFKDSQIKGSALLLIITDLAKNDIFDRALNLAEELGNLYQKSIAFFNITKELVRYGDSSRALIAASSISDKVMKERAIKLFNA